MSVNSSERQNQEVRELEKQKERMERERHERDKLEREREREKQEREQERERQEKQKAEQSVNKHFEESLRRAQQKVRIIYISQCHCSTITIVCACLNSYPLFKLNLLQRTEQNSWNPISLPPPHRSSSEDDRKRAEQEHLQREQQRHLVVRSQEAARDRNYYTSTVVKKITLRCIHYFIFCYIFVAGTEATECVVKSRLPSTCP